MIGWNCTLSQWGACVRAWGREKESRGAGKGRKATTCPARWGIGATLRKGAEEKQRHHQMCLTGPTVTDTEEYSSRTRDRC